MCSSVGHCTCGITKGLALALLVLGFPKANIHGAYVKRGIWVHYHRDADKIYIENVIKSGEIVTTGFEPNALEEIIKHLSRLL